MLKSSLIVVLSLVVGLPSSIAAESWMALSMVEMEHESTQSMTMHDSHGEQHTVSAMGHSSTHAVDAHEHDKADCDEYCMSCSSHCSSSAIISNELIMLEQNIKQLIAHSASIAARAKRLYRPPISLQ